MNQRQLEDILRVYEMTKSAKINDIVGKISRLFNRTFKDAAELVNYAKLINGRLDPATRRKVQELTDKLFGEINRMILLGVEDSGVVSAKLSRAIDMRVQKRIKALPLASYGKKSAGVLRKITTKKDYGETLSKRIWKQNKRTQAHINKVLVDAVKTGKSAKNTAKDMVLAQYKNKSGPGIYADPKKNAERLTRNVINRAYKESDHERWKSAWYIKGIEVKLSNRHPTYDICDLLATVYPKDFKFTGWHVNCLCVAVPILLTEKERDLYEDYTLGIRSQPPALQYVTDPPPEFGKWVSDNKSRMKAWKSGYPDWVTENKKYLKTKL
ncbi:hypothetical protein LL912_00845 [Niabella sp. CC-SYL272]|uniref:hypothetical protein n=1 Tax=Niabella agricola TaxID=2891571 RepID=UPI001F2526D9|nr:hypothetical protein [Niabella agricola]MCF3107314.1 hypothetical protein [Niabella agricola]